MTDEQEHWNRSAMERRVEELEMRDMVDFVARLNEETERAEAAEARLTTVEAALKQAADWFRQYGEGHQAKGDTDKAYRNFDRERHCRAALAPEGTKP